MAGQTGVLTIDPRYMTARGWTSQMALNLWQFGLIPNLKSDDDWKVWARYVVSLPGIAAYGAPWPERFAKWQDWAVQFNLSVQLITT